MKVEPNERKRQAECNACDVASPAHDLARPDVYAYRQGDKQQG